MNINILITELSATSKSPHRLSLESAENPGTKDNAGMGSGSGRRQNKSEYINVCVARKIKDKVYKPFASNYVCMTHHIKPRLKNM